MATTWRDVEGLLDGDQRVHWNDLATGLFAADAAPPDWRIAERLMLRATGSSPPAAQRALLDAYLAFCLRNDQPRAAFDYLAGDEVLRGDDPVLVRCYVELAQRLSLDAELAAGLDWLRAHGQWGEQEARIERDLIGRHSSELLAPDVPETQSTLGALRRFGQRIGLALNGRRPSVLELVPAELPLQVGEAEVRRLAGPARLDMGRMLAGALDPTRSRVALVGLAGTAQQLLWLGQIDPGVVAAIQLAGAGDPHALQQLTASTQWFAAEEFVGNRTRLAGYVAEQQTRVHLLQQGHQVEMPESPTQAGYDMLVDGLPMQVKHSPGAAIIDDHRAAYPDIPVIVNAEHAGRFQDDPMVLIDPQRLYADPYDSIDATLEALHDVPLLTLAPLHLVLAGARHFGRAQSWRQYGEHVAKDAGASMACTAGGAWLFSGVAGIALGPVGVAVAATLGAMIGAGVGDSLGKGWIGDDIGARNDAAAQGLVDLARGTREDAILDKLDAATREWNRLRRWLAEPVQVPLPLSITTFWRAQAQARIDQLTLFTERLDQRLAGGESDQIKAGWQVLQAAGQIAHPGMRQRVATVQDRLAALRA
jgi:hypothetical protein